jgi:hypothetical protein
MGSTARRLIRALVEERGAVVTDLDEGGGGIERLLAILAKLYADVEASGDECPLCARRRPHSADCPLGIAWGLLDEEVHDEARIAMGGRAARREGETDWPDFLSEE